VVLVLPANERDGNSK